MISKTIYANDDGASLSATLTDATGGPINLTGSTVRIAMRPKGMGGEPLDEEMVVVNAAQGKIRYDFDPLEVTEPGDYEIVFQVHFDEGFVTYPTSGPVTMRILPNPLITVDPEVTTLINTGDVFGLTAQTTSIGNIFRAQVLVSLFIDRDLTDPDTLADFDPRDLLRIRQAIAFQAVFLNEGSVTAGGLTLSIPEGVKSLTQGDVRVEMAEASTGTTVEAYLSPMTRRILGKLSWIAGRTIRPRSMFEDPAHPEIYTSEMAFTHKIVRPPLPEPYFWTDR